MTPRFSGYEIHICPSWTRCPVCSSVPLHLLGREPKTDPDYVLALMVEDGLIDASLVDGTMTETMGDPLLGRAA